MSYLGDYAEDYATLNFAFTSRAFATGTPTVLAGTPVISVYKGSATGTEKTSAESYITLSVDFDSKVGLNNVLIDLSGDAFFAVGEDYKVVITTGTVGGVSVVGEEVGTFSIENRFEEVDLTKIGGVAQSATDLKDFADAGYDPGTNKVQGVVLVDTTTTNTDVRGTDSALLASTFSTFRGAITSLAEWLGLIAGKQAADATALAEIKTSGAGSGTYDESTDSLEAVRDNQASGAAYGTLDGDWARSSGNLYRFQCALKLSGENGIVTSGLSSAVVVGVYGNNGDTDLVVAGTSITIGTDGRIYGNFTLGTQPTDDVPAVLVVTVVHGGNTYRGHLYGAEAT